MTHNTTTSQVRRKISKLQTTVLLKKYNEDFFKTPEEVQIAEEFLTKRGQSFTKKVQELSQPVKKEKKAKRVRKIYKADDGKELTKSMYMRRLIRNKNDIKPKELNDCLNKVGFNKAYHSEIKRCRDQYGVIITKK